MLNSASIRLLRWVLSLLPILIIATALYYVANCYFFSGKENNRIVLLLPDSLLPGDPRVEVWQSAAAEEGLQLTLMSDSDFLQPCNNIRQYAGLIIPDQVHKRASDMLVEGIKTYVKDGGKLMLVYDAAIWNSLGVYPTAKSRLSDLAGIDYALYPSLLDRTIQWDEVIGKASGFSSLALPPGKYIETRTAQADQAETRQDNRDSYFRLTAYGYKNLRYPAFVTQGSYRGEVLLKQTNGNLLAGYHREGAGKVLFINTPLGYLKGQTDGVLLHSFLRYFADKVLDLPYLASVPDGVGGIVMNWHLDSRASLQPLRQMQSLGFYEQGPYSIHITAGPGRDRLDDKLGLDVKANPETRSWITFFKKHNYVIGSHGGWLHDFFGNSLTETQQPVFVNYLERNKHALEELLDYPVQEYSAPKGNHPQWVSTWLEQQGMLAYYFTGNTGMGPTRVYRDGIQQHKKIWAFPIQNYDDMTGFDEFKQKALSNELVEQWLIALTDFTIQHKTSRLVYFHPRGVLHYPDASRAWLRYAAKQGNDKKFRWYTMTELAKFLNRREGIQWKMTEDNQSHIFNASHPDATLAHQTWLLPKDRYHRPEITLGNADIVEDDRYWLIVAGEGRQLEFGAAWRQSR
jgi:hypothetical protein